MKPADAKKLLTEDAVKKNYSPAKHVDMSGDPVPFHVSVGCHSTMYYDMVSSLGLFQRPSVHHFPCCSHLVAAA